MSRRARRVAVVLLAATVVTTLATGCRRAKVEGEGRLDPGGRVVLTRDAGDR